MAFTRLGLVVLLGAAFPLLLLFSAVASELGVSYGGVANDLPDPSSVVQLLKDNGITMVRIYDANSNVLSSLANTGIKVMVMVPNENLADVASSSDHALQWVQSNVAAYYPATQIHGVAVGNEVFNSKPDQNSNLVPAMTNIQKALAQLNLADAIKVTTPIAFNAVQSSWPPSSGAFSDDIAQPVMKPMLQFLQQTGSYLSVNYYPYLTYMAQPDDFDLDYVLGNPNPGVVDPDTKLTYCSLLDAQRDATYYAMDKLAASKQMDVHHLEHGAPTGGGLRPGGVATIANAQTYINNLMNRVLSGNTGTPYRPTANMIVYIFALFNKDQKGTGADDVEQHFGLFYPNMRKVYQFDFRGPVTPSQSWCVPNAGVGDARLQAALDYACGHGADCSAIQSGGSCLQPDTKAAHATYAFNSYYQRNGRIPSSCDFNGAASVVYQAPGGRKHGIPVVIVAVLLPSIAALSLVACLCYWKCQRPVEQAKQKYPMYSAEAEDTETVDSMMMDVSTLRAATGDFEETNKLGEGGFGAVYKGVLPDGDEIAVKRLSKSSAQGVEELKNELALVAKLKHKNLVRLIGVCLEQQERLLVYEFVPNRSLDLILFGTDCD